MMYFQAYGYQLHKQCLSAGRVMWRKWDLRRSYTNHNLTLDQQSFDLQAANYKLHQIQEKYVFRCFIQQMDE